MPSIPTDQLGDVVGFGSLSPYKERAAYRTSVEDSVYVRRDRGGQGIGKLILTELLQIAAASGFHAVFGRISASSEASIALHRSCGFELVGIEREVGRKFNKWLDVALMQALLARRRPHCVLPESPIEAAWVEELRLPKPFPMQRGSGVRPRDSASAARASHASSAVATPD